ncbi:MAG: thermonuclease family protein [Nitrosomonadales bacterium]
MRALLLLLVCIFNVAQAEEFSAKIIVVIDGDTVVIRQTKGLVKIRLAEIDAPEKAQIFGDQSMQSLSGMVLHKQVKVTSRAMDKYGRMVANLSINGLDVNAEQVRRGMAWEYHSGKRLIALQEEAKNASRGLWAESNPTPPWVWRKQHPNNWPVNKSNAVGSPRKTLKTSTLRNPACANKRRCLQMASCEEAKYYFTVCGVKTLDGNHDGMPCDKLCGAEKSK